MRGEVEEGRASELFAQRCVMIEGDEQSSYARLLDCVSHCYGGVVPLRKVWGYGRQLWDAQCRVFGNKPLKVMVLGPAAAGKSTLCKSLSKVFNMPWVDAGQLLQSEIKARTALGLRAKKYIDATMTVPDDIFITLVQARLAEEDCMRGGWIMDGFPHSYGQISELEVCVQLRSLAPTPPAAASMSPQAILGTLPLFVCPRAWCRSLHDHASAALRAAMSNEPNI